MCESFAKSKALGSSEPNEVTIQAVMDETSELLRQQATEFGNNFVLTKVQRCPTRVHDVISLAHKKGAYICGDIVRWMCSNVTDTPAATSIDVFCCKMPAWHEIVSKLTQGDYGYHVVCSKATDALSNKFCRCGHGAATLIGQPDDNRSGSSCCCCWLGYWYKASSGTCRLENPHLAPTDPARVVYVVPPQIGRYYVVGPLSLKQQLSCFEFSLTRCGLLPPDKANGGDETMTALVDSDFHVDEGNKCVHVKHTVDPVGQLMQMQVFVQRGYVKQSAAVANVTGLFVEWSLRERCVATPSEMTIAAMNADAPSTLGKLTLPSSRWHEDNHNHNDDDDGDFAADDDFSEEEFVRLPAISEDAEKMGYLIELADSYGGYICGSAARVLTLSATLVPEDEADDVDIFFKNREGMWNMREQLVVHHGYRPERFYDSSNRHKCFEITLINKALSKPMNRVQLVAPNWQKYTVLGTPTLQQQLRLLDFTVARCGILTEKLGAEEVKLPWRTLPGFKFRFTVLADKHLERDAESRRLSIKHIVCPVQGVARIFKYAKKGFTTAHESVRRLLQDWSARALGRTEFRSLTTVNAVKSEIKDMVTTTGEPLIDVDQKAQNIDTGDFAPRTLFQFHILARRANRELSLAWMRRHYLQLNTHQNQDQNENENENLSNGEEKQHADNGAYEEALRHNSWISQAWKLAHLKQYKPFVDPMIHAKVLARIHAVRQRFQLDSMDTPSADTETFAATVG